MEQSITSITFGSVIKLHNTRLHIYCTVRTTKPGMLHSADVIKHFRPRLYSNFNINTQISDLHFENNV